MYIFSKQRTGVHTGESEGGEAATYDIWCTFKRLLNLYGPLKVGANCLTIIYKLFISYKQLYSWYKNGIQQINNV